MLILKLQSPQHFISGISMAEQSGHSWISWQASATMWQQKQLQSIAQDTPHCCRQTKIKSLYRIVCIYIGSRATLTTHANKKTQADYNIVLQQTQPHPQATQQRCILSSFQCCNFEIYTGNGPGDETTAMYKKHTMCIKFILTSLVGQTLSSQALQSGVLQSIRSSTSLQPSLS